MADSSADVVLRARLGLLRGSLLTVQRALSDIEDCRAGGAAAVAVTSAVNGGAAADVATVARDLRVAIASLTVDDDVRNRLNGLAAQLAAAAEGRPEPLRPRLLALDKTSVAESLGDEVTTALEDLDAVDALVARAIAEQDAPPSEEQMRAKERMLADAWTAYRTCRDACELVFAEYVDLVRGVLLRDALFDQDLCRIADELVRLFGQVKEYVWNAFTIPSSREQRDASFARLIRIGFPEWNVWTLPLTAHEFGHVFTARHEAMQELVEVTAAQGHVARTEVKGWVADAFATSVMGPAYVWAAMLLRIDPADETDRRRVQVMQLALGLLQDRPLSTYPDAAGRIEQAWSGALVQTGGWDAPPAPVLDSMRNLVDRVHRRIRDPFGVLHWDTALALVDALRDPGRSPADVAGPLVPAQLRHVLVAGWIARVGLSDQRPASEGAAAAQQAAVALLGERVRQVCLVLVDRVGDAGTPGGGAPGAGRPAGDKAGDQAEKSTADAVIRGLRTP